MFHRFQAGGLLHSMREAGVRRHLLALRERIRTVRDGEEFLPGVQALLTPGHTPGHLAFLFGGWCLTGDVAFHDPLSC